MRKYALTAGIVCFLGVAAYSAVVKFNGYIANESGIAITKTFPVPLNQLQVDQESVVIIFSSANPTNVVFTDGSTSTGTITVVSTQAIVTNTVTLCIFTKCGTEGVSWQVSTATGTATSIANWINTDSTLNLVLIATAPVGSSVVYATATAVGSQYNFATFSSSQNALGISTSFQSVNGSSTGTFTNGNNANYTINTTVIGSTNPYFSATPGNSNIPLQPMVALPVLYTQGAVALVGLTNQTTYFVIPITLNAFGLSTTSTGAVAGYNELPNVSSSAIAGTFILFGSSRTNLTADLFTLKPLAFSGSPVGKWEVSNDGNNWSSFSSSGTVSLGPSGITTLNNDFGTVNFSWLRFNVSTAPSAGALVLQIEANGKNSSQ